MNEIENKVEGNNVEKLVSNIIEVAETRFDLVAIEVQDKVSDILASIASIALLGVIGMIALMLFSVGGAICLSQYLRSEFLGYMCVGGFYVVLGIILYAKRKMWIRLPIINTLLRKINFHEED